MARGSVYQRGKTWSIQYDVGKDDATGKRKLVGKGGFESREAAEKALTKALAELDAGTHVMPSRETFAGYARFWLDHVIPTSVRPQSAERYRQQVEGYLIPVLGTTPLQKLIPSQLRAAVAASEKRLSQQGRRDVYTRLRQILACAVTDHYLAINPMAGIAAPKVRRREMRVWTPAQLDAFLSATRGSRLGVLWHVYAMTGMRRGEALGLRWDDVDWGRPTLAIAQQVVRRPGNALAFDEPKTHASSRTVTIGPATVVALREQRSAVAFARKAEGDAWVNNDLVFPFQHGRPWRPDVISHYFPDAIRDANAAHGLDLPAIRLHDLRHTNASIFLMEDGNIKVLAARLGHDPAVLLRTYAHIMPQSEERAVARLEAAILGAAERAEASPENGIEAL